MRSAIFKRAGRIVLAVAMTVAALSVAVAPASPAAAACQTRAHAYYISLPSQTIYLSGYEGEVGAVPVLRTRAGERYQLGGNGIQPGTRITWKFVNTSTGQVLGVDPQPPNTAGSNCVVNQSPPTYSVTAPVGTYDVKATYTGGNTGVTYTDHLIMRAVVLP